MPRSENAVPRVESKRIRSCFLVAIDTIGFHKTDEVGIANPIGQSFRGKGRQRLNLGKAISNARGCRLNSIGPNSATRDKTEHG
jgi:hypothetical protein